MGSIGGLLGLNGGAGGTGFAGPQQTNIVQPFNAQTATNAANQAQNAIQQQQNFLNSVQAQNGLGNQTNVYNQLQGVANGTGPNPAQAQLAQATGANTANQAALMAGQRGSGANAGLIARQAAMQGGANQQNAAGQAASLQANQSLNALGQMGGLANTQAAQQAAAVGGLNNAVQGQEGQVLGAIQGANNSNVGMQSNINSANAGLANTTMQGQQGAIGGLLNSGLGMLTGKAEGGLITKPGYAEGTGSVQAIPQVVAPSGPRSSIAKVLSGMGGQPQDSVPNFGNPGANALASGISKGMNSLKSSFTPNPNNSMADPSQHYANLYGAPSANMAGNSDDAFNQAHGMNTTQGSQYAGGTQQRADIANQQAPMQSNMANNVGLPVQSAFPQQMQAPQSMDISDQEAKINPNDPKQEEYARGGKVPAMVSPGEKYLSPQEAQMAKQGANPMKLGETIPGKPKVDGAKNDYANDTVPKTLDEGGLVLPRSVTQSKNPEWAAHKFVRDHMAKGGLVGMKVPKKGKK